MKMKTNIEEKNLPQAVTHLPFVGDTAFPSDPIGIALTKK